MRKLKSLSLLTLFITSYSPLFVILIIRQISKNIDIISTTKFNNSSLLLYFQKFGLSVFVLLFLILGILGFHITFKNIRKNSENGNLVWLRDIKNKNSEAIGYIATYIIPFLFQSFESIDEIAVFFLLFFIIYRIYINSTLILINPVLSIFYSIFEIEYERNGKICNGLIVSKEKHLKEDTEVFVYEIGHKLYYLTPNYKV